MDIKKIDSWADLYPHGFNCLTGEACNLNMRLLIDMTRDGALVFRELLGLPYDCPLKENYNSGAGRIPYVASAMMPRELLLPLGAMVLYKLGYKLIVSAEHGVIGLAGPTPEIEECLDIYREMKTYDRILIDKRAESGQPHVGTENVHAATGQTHSERPVADPEADPEAHLNWGRIAAVAAAIAAAVDRLPTEPPSPGASDSVEASRATHAEVVPKEKDEWAPFFNPDPLKPETVEPTQMIPTTIARSPGFFKDGTLIGPDHLFDGELIQVNDGQGRTFRIAKLIEVFPDGTARYKVKEVTLVPPRSPEIHKEKIYPPAATRKPKDNPEGTERP